MAPERYEVIVTDDGRRSTAAEMLRTTYPWARWTAGPARGIAANRNHGAEVANADWLIYTDDDCLPDANWLSTMAEAIASVRTDESVILQGATIQTEPPPSLLWEAPHDPFAKGRITANFAIRQCAFAGLGGIDERYQYAFEDIEFFARALSSGLRFVSIPQAVVRHPLRRRPGPVKLAQRWEGRVVSALDQGAPPCTVLWRLPWHVLRVNQSRFRDQQWNWATLQAAWLFSREWLIVASKTPGWVRKWSRQPRSDFWSQYVAAHGCVPKYGF